MNVDKKRQELASYRLREAKESLEEAEFLLLGKKSPRSVINRAYYAMFYAVLALLVYEPYASSKHSGVLGYFNKRFIKEGVFDKSLGKSINKAFEVRKRGDYREYVELTYDQVEPFIDKARVFIREIEDYLEKKVFSGNSEE